MYTQCPECNAIFALSAEQLAACNGLVRCGQCAAVFRADERLFDALPETVAPPAGTQALMQAAPRDDNPAIPTVTQRPPRRRTRRVLWAFGNLLLLIALLAQGIYFYRNEIAARYPHVRPWLVQACDYVGCTLRPLQDVGQIELIAAQVAPNPEYENVLSVTASLVNHARYTQPFPLMEVSLLDSNGVTLARRTFPPQQYLAAPKQVREGMAPNEAVAASLQITSSDKRAVGYEIQLVAP